MAKKSAMQLMIEWLDRELENVTIKDSPVTSSLNRMPYSRARHKATELLATEKADIEETWEDAFWGGQDEANGDGYLIETGEQYYNETFGEETK